MKIAAGSANCSSVRKRSQELALKDRATLLTRYRQQNYNAKSLRPVKNCHSRTMA